MDRYIINYPRPDNYHNFQRDFDYASMLVPLEGYQETWQTLIKESISHSSYNVVMFVSCLNVDAFAAAMMLAELLKKNLILYKIEPVVGYNSLKNGFMRLDSSVLNVILVGCGSSVDLEDFFHVSVSKEGTPNIHVFDCVRPWNLDNLFGSTYIYCYDDETDEKWKTLRQAYEFLASNQEEIEDEHTEHEDVNGSEEYDSGKFDARNENNERKRRRILASDTESEEEDNEINNNNEEDTQEDPLSTDDVVGHTEPHKNNSGKESQRMIFSDIIEKYYDQGTYLNLTSCIQVYTLLTMLGETSASTLWLAVLGLTSVEQQYPQLYRSLLPSLQDEWRRLMSIKDSGNERGCAGSSRSLKFFPEYDYSLFLLRQWSLYESMIHSSYISANLALWSDQGKKKLHRILATMGITLQESKESWIHTKPSLKRELRSKLQNVGNSYNIQGVTRDGIVRQFGLNGSMSAGDCVESISAYLEIGNSKVFGAAPSGSSNTSNNIDIDNTIEGASKHAVVAQENWVNNFWIAWDAIDDFEKLKTGVEQAKLLQQAVVSTANAVFDKKMLMHLQSFAMVVIHEAPEIRVFLNPLSLQRLATWISESSVQFTGGTNQPMVLAVLNECIDGYLVLGMGPLKLRDASEETQTMTDQCNNFGVRFRETAERINARIKVDAFDSSIIEVSRQDLPRFLEALDVNALT